MNDDISVKVFRVDKSNQSYCYECGNQEEILRGATPWEKITREKFVALNEAVGRANLFHGSKHHYFVVNDMTSDLGEIFETADQYSEWVAREEKRRSEEAKIAAEKRKSSSLERKRKQLEKLQKELGK